MYLHINTKSNFNLHVMPTLLSPSMIYLTDHVAKSRYTHFFNCDVWVEFGVSSTYSVVELCVWGGGGRGLSTPFIFSDT